MEARRERREREKSIGENSPRSKSRVFRTNNRRLDLHQSRSTLSPSIKVRAPLRMFLHLVNNTFEFEAATIARTLLSPILPFLPGDNNLPPNDTRPPRPGPLIRQGSAPCDGGWVRSVVRSVVLGSLEWLSGAIHGGIKTIRHAVTDSLARSRD